MPTPEPQVKPGSRVFDHYSHVPCVGYHEIPATGAMGCLYVVRTEDLVHSSDQHG
jgi:hypothetical protein